LLEKEIWKLYRKQFEEKRKQTVKSELDATNYSLKKPKNSRLCKKVKELEIDTK